MDASLRAAFFSLMASTVLLTASASAAPTADEVGDVDSFGRPVKYLGVKSTSQVQFDTVCTPDPAFPDEICRVIPPTSTPTSVTINEPGLATMKIPGGSARSLLCFTVQPVGAASFTNYSTTNQMASLSLRAAITLQNDTLNNPALIDPVTNLPMNGKMEIPLTIYSEGRTLPVGHIENKTLSGARACIGGLITRRSLIDGYGLTSTQAALFFSRPITLTLGLTGSARSLEYGSFAYGVRIYGD